MLNISTDTCSLTALGLFIDIPIARDKKCTLEWFLYVVLYQKYRHRYGCVAWEIAKSEKQAFSLRPWAGPFGVFEIEFSWLRKFA